MCYFYVYCTIVFFAFFYCYIRIFFMYCIFFILLLYCISKVVLYLCFRCCLLCDVLYFSFVQFYTVLKCILYICVLYCIVLYWLVWFRLFFLRARTLFDFSAGLGTIILYLLSVTVASFTFFNNLWIRTLTDPFAIFLFLSLP